MIAGVDYSLSSPAVCVGEPGAHSNDCLFLGFTKVQKHIGTYKNVTLLEYPDWTQPQERFVRLANKFIEFLVEHDVEEIWIEGYSFGSSGRVFDLSENTGHFKVRLWQERFPFESLAPTTVKKHATGSGKADKNEMYKAWLKRGGHDINAFFSPKAKNVGSPVNDLVDAYFMMDCGWAQKMLKSNQS